MSEILEIMRARHSVRQYTKHKIEPAKRAVLDELCSKCNEESGLHIQMVYDEPKCFNSFLAHYGKFENVYNYIAIVGKKGPDLDEKAGYYGEKIVLKAQEMGLNTCWVAITRGKVKAKVERGEKVAIIISIGYGATQGIAHKDKPLEMLVKNYNEIDSADPVGENAPQWFREGVEAALLAPTAVNQQKFFIALDADKVTITAQKGPCYKIDLGIVKYHFDAVTEGK